MLQLDEILSTDTQNLAANTILCGIAMSLMFNPTVAVYSMIANAALSKLNDHQSIPAWYPLSTRANNLSSYWEDSPPLFRIQLITGLLFKGCGIAINQVGIQQRLRRPFASPVAAISAIFYSTVRAPIVEEIIFRGFLQEKIKDVQIYCFGQDSETLKTCRIVIQAVLFGSMHYHVAQGLFWNATIIMITGTVGLLNGFIKEDSSNLWKPSAFHAHVNSSVTARIILFGA